MSMKQSTSLPSIDLLRQLVAIDEKGDLVWLHTRRPASCRSLFVKGRTRAFVLGWMVIDAGDVIHALTTGSWPAVMQPERHVRNDDVLMQWIFADRNNVRAEIIAADEAKRAAAAAAAQVAKVVA